MYYITIYLPASATTFDVSPSCLQVRAPSVSGVIVKLNTPSSVRAYPSTFSRVITSPLRKNWASWKSLGMSESPGAPSIQRSSTRLKFSARG